MTKIVMRRLRWMIVGAWAVSAADQFWAGGQMTAALRAKLADVVQSLGGWTQEGGDAAAETMRDVSKKTEHTLTTATDAADAGLQSAADEIHVGSPKAKAS